MAIENSQFSTPTSDQIRVLAQLFSHCVIGGNRSDGRVRNSPPNLCSAGASPSHGALESNLMHVLHRYLNVTSNHPISASDTKSFSFRITCPFCL